MNRSRPHSRGLFLFLILAALVLASLTAQAFAIDESDVQSAIAASSSEQVSGNVFIWFLCAVAFLKISQKIDSFMTSLGINVGRTGGSMLGELMIAGRAIGLAAKSTGSAVGNIFNRGNAVNNADSPPAGQAFTGTGGGMIGSISRAAGNAAAANATGTGKGVRNSIGGAMFDSSLKHDGQFSKNVIGAIATGSISSVGSITGHRAAQALTSYLGYESQDQSPDANNPPADGTSSGASESSQPVGAGIPVNAQPQTGSHTQAQVSSPTSVPGDGSDSQAGVPSTADEPPSDFRGVPVSAPEDIITPYGGTAASIDGATPQPQPSVVPVSEAPHESDEPPSQFHGVPYSGAVPPADTVTLDGGTAAAGIESSASSAPASVFQGWSIPSGGLPESGTNTQPIPPTFRNVEIGGGRITGYETPADGGPERQFAMYNASQYMEPTGPYETVKTRDGESWYKQYAQPTVQRTPREESPGKIKFDEKIVQTMPQIPKRKDRV